MDDYDKLPESDAIVNYVHYRYNKGLYTHLLTTGLPGTGKSSACIRLAELISLKLHKEIRLSKGDIIDSPLKLLTRIRKIKGPGEIIIIEEVSVLFPSRRAMAMDNLSIARVLDTCRKKRVILLSNAPVFTSIDAYVRVMSHILLETLKINKTKQVCIFKAWKLQTNPHSGKCYRHRFNRHGYDIGKFFVKKPGTTIWDEYEEGKDEFLDKLYEREEMKLRLKEEKENKQLGLTEGRMLVASMTPIQQDVYNHIELRGETPIQYAERNGKNVSTIYEHLRSAKKKVVVLGGVMGISAVKAMEKASNQPILAEVQKG